MRLIFKTSILALLENTLRLTTGLFPALRIRDLAPRVSFLTGLTIGCMLILARMSFAASAPDSVKKANNLYREGKYYNEAEVDMPHSDVVNFNTGAALYQKGDYEKAIEAFNKALLSDNPGIEEKAAYNIGNSKYRSGKLKENTELASAVNLYREALDYYKRAIELNQKSAKAKYNHEFVERELKILLDKLKQQQKRPQQEKQQEQKQEQKQEPKQEQAQSAASKQEQKEQEQKPLTSQMSRAQDEEEKKGMREEPSQEEAKGYKPRQTQEEMSKEEARMILDRYNQQDQSIGNIDRNARGRRYPPALKDW